MSRREQIEALLADSPDDTFLLYGLGLELLKEGDVEGALARWARVVEIDPDHSAAYQQAGQALMAQGRAEEARAQLTAGIAAAGRKGNAHAAEEMRGLLEQL